MFNDSMLNKMHSIILNPPPHSSPSCAPIVRTACQSGSETFPPPSGSTNTAGQALARLSLGTSDTTLRTRYDHSRGHSSNHVLRRLDWQPRNSRGTNFRSWRKNKDTRFNFAEVRPEQCAWSARPCINVRLLPAAAAHTVRDAFIVTISSTVRRKATIPKKNRSLLKEFFHTTEHRCSQLRETNTKSWAGS